MHLSFLRNAVFLCLAILLTHCGGTSNMTSTGRESTGAYAGPTVDSLLSQSRSTESPAAEAYLLDAVELAIAQASNRQARALLGEIADAAGLPPGLQARYAMSQATLALIDDDLPVALRWLTGNLVSGVGALQPDLQIRLWQLRAGIYRSADQPLAAIADLSRLLSVAPTSSSSEPRNTLWQLLDSLGSEQLDELAATADSYELRGWVELARQMGSQQNSIKSQLDSLARWRAIWTRHRGSSVLPDSLLALERIWAERPRQIGLLLPLQDQIGKAVQEGFLSAYYEALSLGEEVPRIAVYDTSPLLDPQSPQDIHGLYDTAIADGAELIIGPLDKNLVRQLHGQRDLPVPTLALNYADYPERNSQNFYQFGLAPEDEIRQAATLAWQAGHRHAAIVSPGGPDYLRLGESFSAYWSGLGGAVVSRATFSSENEYADIIKHLLGIDASETRAARIRSLLPRSDIEFVPRRRQDIDFIFLMANPRQGRQIKPTLAFYFAGDIPVYALSAIYDGLENQLADQDLNGIVFTDTPWVLRNDDPLKQEVVSNLRVTQGPLQRLRALGIDSFRLYPRLTQLASGQLADFQGSTGVLTMTSQGSIQRQPESAIFVDGKVRIANVGELVSTAPR
ncbi:MAG: hypothetical protein RLZZ385_1789 [Pseudomonadota bacterium]|jgi:outer membrane PBP1 activator LpoA protein